MTLAEAIAVVEELRNQSPQPHPAKWEFEADQRDCDALLLVLDAAKQQERTLEACGTECNNPSCNYLVAGLVCDRCGCWQVQPTTN